MSLYHCTHNLLVKGDTIAPGNWGSTIFNMGVNHTCWKREMALEAVRSWNFPHKPSRLKSTFACETIEAIRAYKAHSCPQGFIYEVEPENNARMHRGDFNAVEPLPRSPHGMWEIADMYWRHALKTTVQEWPDVECIELVFECPLRVIRSV